jgi:hypothetical protein
VSTRAERLGKLDGEHARLWQIVFAAAKLMHWFADLDPESLDQVEAALKALPADAIAARDAALANIVREFAFLGVAPGLASTCPWEGSSVGQARQFLLAMGPGDGPFDFTEMMRAADDAGLLTPEMRAEWLPDRTAEPGVGTPEDPQAQPTENERWAAAEGERRRFTDDSQAYIQDEIDRHATATCDVPADDGEYVDWVELSAEDSL